MGYAKRLFPFIHAKDSKGYNSHYKRDIIFIIQQSHAFVNFLYHNQGGLVGGLDTLCGQAYGAKQYQKLGVYTTSAMISLLLICPPSCILWALMGKILPLIGQDPLISKEAGKYSLLLIPGLFGSAILKPLTRYLQTQSLIIPLLVSSFTILCLHVPICWIFVYKSELRYLGAALAFSISIWLNLIMLGVYVRCSSTCNETRGSFLSKDAFFAIGEFFVLAVPSAAMAW